MLFISTNFKLKKIHVLIDILFKHFKTKLKLKQEVQIILLTDKVCNLQQRITTPI